MTKMKPNTKHKKKKLFYCGYGSAVVSAFDFRASKAGVLKPRLWLIWCIISLDKKLCLYPPSNPGGVGVGTTLLAA